MSTAQRYVTATDGVRLAVHTDGDPSNPTIVAIHGYPDDHTVWDGVVADLAEDFHVVRYDVRGAGASDRPRGRRAYRIAQLASDLQTVLDAVVPDQPVHVLAHDWGSIQTWETITDPAWRDRLLSYTSISGPSLDMVGVWLRRAADNPRAVVRQLLDSYYVALFQLPVVPELGIRLGIVAAVVRHSSTHGLPAGSAAEPPSPADARHGLGLYRANFLPRLTRPRPRRTAVPVQLLTPRGDLHVDAEMQQQVAAPWCDDLRVHELEGNHWVVRHDATAVAGLTRSFVSEIMGLADRPLF
jgi:pimeloyl-ACP methyl ester carboxylesterase